MLSVGLLTEEISNILPYTSFFRPQSEPASWFWWSPKLTSRWLKYKPSQGRLRRRQCPFRLILRGKKWFCCFLCSSLLRNSTARFYFYTYRPVWFPSNAAVESWRNSEEGRTVFHKINLKKKEFYFPFRLNVMVQMVQTPKNFQRWSVW